MKSRFAIILLLSLTCFYSTLFSQSYSIKGQVCDENNNPVVDAQLLINGMNQTVFTNEQGLFVFEGLSAGKHQINIYHVGYVSQAITLTSLFPIDSMVHIFLQPKEIPLEKLTVTTSRLKLEEIKISSPVNIVSAEAIQLFVPASSA